MLGRIRKFLFLFDPWIKLILIGAVLLLGIFLWQTKSELTVLKSPPSPVEDESVRSLDNQQSGEDNIFDKQAVANEDCGVVCENKIKDLIAKAIATISAKLQTAGAVKTPTKTTKMTQVSYVPVGSSGSTTKTDWTSLTATDFFFDIGEYGTVKEARWSANVKIFQNGQAYARLFDVTHGTAVQGSEISTQSVSYSLIDSAPLTFTSGKNVYRVQMKSLTGYEASFDSGRIKIIWE